MVSVLPDSDKKALMSFAKRKRKKNLKIFLNREINVFTFSISMCVNSSANPQKKPDGSFEQLGNKTECALIELADTFGYKYQTYRSADKVD
jgi:magnesium-transporting ATPase (P-type)